MSKKKRGRPPAENPASEKLPMVRLTPEQLSRYREAAEAKEKPLSAWVRTHLDKAAKRDLKKS